MRGWVEGKRQTEGDQPQELRAPCYIPNIYFRKISNEDFCGLFYTSTFPFPTPYVTFYSLKPPSRRFSTHPICTHIPSPNFSSQDTSLCQANLNPSDEKSPVPGCLLRTNLPFVKFLWISPPNSFPFLFFLRL